MKGVMQTAIVAAAAGLAGCSFHARDAESYRSATRELVSTQNDALQHCYDQHLEENENAGGRVVVHFTVKEETGRIADPKVDEAKSTASSDIQQCVVQAIDGLELKPADARTGKATFVWEFKAKDKPKA